MSIEVKMIADSITKNGYRISTLELKYHRFFHSEFLTHRIFSRNASSSRAIPIKKIISQVWNDPAMPLFWGQNISGMQAKVEITGVKLFLAKFIWQLTSKIVCVFAYTLYLLNLHKQIGNRILEPWQYINVIVTSTEWSNFFSLRLHPDAQPEFQELAAQMKSALDLSIPEVLDDNAWHLPYILLEEKKQYDIETLLKMSVARCARVSYKTHDGKTPDVDKDIELHDRLVGSQPIHASPSEHQATPAEFGLNYYKNFRGWIQYRTFIEKNIKPNKVFQKIGGFVLTATAGHKNDFFDELHTKRQ